MKIPRRKRKVTTITLNPEIVEKARKHGLNISRISEDALKETIKKLEHEAEPMGAPAIKKGGEKVIRKLPWATVAIIILVAAIGAFGWSQGWFRVQPAEEEEIQPEEEIPPPTTGAWRSISVVGLQSGWQSGIIAVYIAKTGQDNNDNWSDVATTDNYYYKFTATGGTGNIPTLTDFFFLIEVVGHTDNGMAYVSADNVLVELEVTSGSWTLTAENSNAESEGTGDGAEVTFLSDANEIGINAIWDNNGNYYQLPADGSIDWQVKEFVWG